MFGVVRDTAPTDHTGHRDSARVCPRLPSVTAPTQPDGHHQTPEHLHAPADEAQHQAVSHTNVGGRGEDGGHDVSVPRHWDDGEDPRDEDEDTSDARDGPVRGFPPAPDSGRRHAEGDDIEDE